MEKCIVVGLGFFGFNLAQKLMEKGAEVIAVDSNMELVNEIQDIVTYSMCLDSTDEKALNALGLPDFDVGIVCIGEDFEANLLTSVLLKNGGVKKVIARSSNPIHMKILMAVGIDEVISPGLEAAEKLAFSLLHRNLLDMIHIDEKNSVAKITAPAVFVGKSIGALSLRAKYGLNVIAVNRIKEVNGKEETVQSNPGAETIIEANDVLLVIGDPHRLEELTENS